VKQTPTAAVAAWALLLAGAILAPRFRASPDPGDDWTRNTVRVALAFYAAAAGLMLVLRPAEWDGSGRGDLARCCWSLAWAAYVIHVGTAFHFYHHWSHADAVRHTEDVSAFGPGIYVSHLFTLLWTCDVAWWWLWPRAYATRPAWIGRTLHGFMALIVFNGTVVYESGAIRWAGAAMFVALGVLWLYERARGVDAEAASSARPAVTRPAEATPATEADSPAVQSPTG
jgi:hypothetical protein